MKDKLKTTRDALLDFPFINKLVDDGRLVGSDFKLTPLEKRMLISELKELNRSENRASLEAIATFLDPNIFKED